MSIALEGLCSMATSDLLADLGEVVGRRRSLAVHFTAAGGVDVVREVRAGSRADLAVLSAEQMEHLEADDLLMAGTLRALFVSEVVAAVSQDAPSVHLSSEDDLMTALLAARTVAHSTGPSGDALLALITRWGLDHTIGDRLVCTAPGHSVASLLTSGEADLGFQQRSELSNCPGVRILGPLPGAAAIHSTFSGAVLARSSKPEQALEVLEFLGSTAVEDEVVAAGMALAAMARRSDTDEMRPTQG